MADDLSLASDLTSSGSFFGLSSSGGGAFSPQSRNNMRFHSLQTLPRNVSPESMKIGKTNRDGLHKLDINMTMTQAKLNEVYHDDAVSRHRLEVRPSVGGWNEASQSADFFKQPRDLGRPAQVSKGLANFSSIKFGDDRIQRVSTAHREEYRHPSDRKA